MQKFSYIQRNPPKFKERMDYDENPAFFDKMQNLQIFLDSPLETLSSPIMSIDINEILAFLCDNKLNINFRPFSRQSCMFCFQLIEDFNLTVSLSDCKCFQVVHKECLKREALEISDNALDERLSLIGCTTCGTTLNFSLFEKAFGYQNFMNIKNAEQKRLEDANIQLGLKLQEQDRELILEKERNATFECSICMSKVKIEMGCITLDCDHKFCNNCLHEDIITKLKENKVKEDEIACYDCKRPISNFIIKNVLTFKEFMEYEKKIIAFNSSGYISKEEVLIKCPNSKCPYQVIISNNYELTHIKCTLCQLLFCSRGCPKPHEGKTCEEHKYEIQLARDNKNNDQLFEQLKQRDNIKVCPHCGANIQKNQGCNHMTCRVCKTEFCYVCGKRPGKNCH